MDTFKGRAALRSLLSTMQRSARILGPGLSTRRNLYSNNSFLRVSEEVQDALKAKRPVVALESTIYTHGYPYPDNVALASRLESIVRLNGGLPATIGILDGVARVGLAPEELVRLAASAGKEHTLKVSRRDLGYICGLGYAGRRLNGGTTVAGTMVLAHLAGIKVFATGGLGGVHRGAESSMDISADLTELGRTPVAVISSGCKSFLDIPRTLEYLETEGVCVATFADGREGKIDLPAFYSRDSGIRSPMVLKNEEEAAAVIHAQSTLPVKSGLLFANPIPEEHSIPMSEMDGIIAEALQQAHAAGAFGKDNTPFILARIKELTGGKSLKANRALIEANVARGTKVAVELAKLQLREPDGGAEQISVSLSSSLKTPPEAVMNRDVTSGNLETFSKEPSILPTDIIVAGALAVDFSCDFAPLPGSLPALAPQLYTSNPATISQSLGGVAHNIARASHYMGVSVKLCSVVGGDLTGKAAIGQLSAQGMQTDGVQIMPSESGQRTAQYVAINDAKKSLMVAMADMSILENISDELLVAWSNSLRQDKPKWVVVDANWSPEILHEWITTAKEAGAHVAFEPVSAPKSTRLFGSESGKLLSVFPQNKIDIATPNILELAAMHTAAQQAGLFDRQDWWEVIDSLGIPSTGARTKYAMAVGAELVDRGVPQQNVQLLPFIPCILTKLGTRGVLLTRLLPAGDDRLISPEAAPYILATSEARETVGGVYMRLFPPAQVVPDEEVVSVNGVGDTFLGVLVAGLLRRKGARVEDLIELAQKGSALTLKSRESVSPEVGSLRALMD